MDANNKDLKSGTVKFIEYTREDFENSIIRPVVYGIYDGVKDFDNHIIFIMKASAKGTKTLSDILAEFAKKYKKKDVLVIAQAGTLGALPEFGSVDDSLPLLAAEKEALYKAEFTNVIWNYRIGVARGNPDTFIYTNEFGTNFIANNKGENDDGKIINRFG